MGLTDVKIRALKSEGKAYRLSDGNGLYLFISSSGGKLWRWNYRHGGKQKTVSYGNYPDLSLADARDVHKAARTELAKGNDPMAQRMADKVAAKTKDELEKSGDTNSFKAVALKWHSWWAPGVGTDTADYILRRLMADVFPVIGHKPITEIKPAEIRNLILAVESGEGKGRRFKGIGARDVAKRLHGTISQIYRYAVTRELAELNPAAAFKPSDVLSQHKVQHRAHIAPSQLPDLLAAMENYDGHTVVKLALKLMALTFVRTQELLKVPWSEIDFESALWRIPGERMKKDRPHIVPLALQAISILRELKQLAGEKLYVFPGLNAQTAQGTINSNSLLDALEELGYKGVMTGHGYRGLARTIFGDNGFAKEHVELQLAHANDDKTDAAYNHALYLPQRIQLMQWWADYLDKELNKKNAKVVA